MLYNHRLILMTMITFGSYGYALYPYDEGNHFHRICRCVDSIWVPPSRVREPGEGVCTLLPFASNGTKPRYWDFRQLENHARDDTT